MICNCASQARLSFHFILFFLALSQFLNTKQNSNERKEIRFLKILFVLEAHFGSLTMEVIYQDNERKLKSVHNLKSFGSVIAVISCLLMFSPLFADDDIDYKMDVQLGAMNSEAPTPNDVFLEFAPSLDNEVNPAALGIQNLFLPEPPDLRTNSSSGQSFVREGSEASRSIPTSFAFSTPVDVGNDGHES